MQQQRPDDALARHDAKTRATPSHLTSEPLKAIALILLAVCCFSLTDASGKYLIAIGKLPLAQVVWVRFIGQFLAIVFTLGLVSVPTLLRSARPPWQLFRSCLLLSSTVFNFLALKTLRLDQVMTIQFLTPLVVALLAGPLLGEWVGWRRMVAILCGFVGVVIAVRPGSGAIDPAFLMALLAMGCYASFTLVTRYLAPYDGVSVTLFYSMLAGIVLSAPFALLEWTWPQSVGLWLVVLTCGMWAAMGHALFIAAFRFAPASTVSPFTYAGLLSHTTAGFLVFGQAPDGATLAGAAVVVASGLYLLHRERVKKVGSAG